MDKLELIRRNGPQAMELLMAAFPSFKRIAPNGRQAEIRIRNTPDALEQAWRLKLLAQWVDSYLSLGGRKVAAPAKFAKVWRELNDEYREVIDTSGSLAIKSGAKGRTVAETPSVFDLLDMASQGVDIPESDDTLFDYWDWRTSTKGRPLPPSFDGETEFHPNQDDPVRLIKMAVDYFGDQDWKADDEDYFNNSKKVRDAWDFLKDSLGLDTAGLWGRWTTAPMVLSQHVGHPTISDLFDEAVRTYAFGQFTASMVMCRALLEESLDKLYGVHGDGLQGKIDAAQQRLGDPRAFQLTDLKKAADDVLHNPSRWRQRSKEAEKLALRFLESLKAVIEDADGRKKR